MHYLFATAIFNIGFKKIVFKATGCNDTLMVRAKKGVELKILLWLNFHMSEENRNLTQYSQSRQVKGSGDCWISKVSKYPKNRAR